MGKELGNISEGSSNEEKIAGLREAGIDFVPDGARHLRILIKGSLSSRRESIYWTTSDGTDMKIHVKEIKYKEYLKLQNLNIKERHISS